MKIKLGFVTNSSSMCYILDKRTLTDEDLAVVRNNSLRQPTFHGVSRCSAYGEGEAVERFIAFLKEDDAAWAAEGYDYGNPLTEWLQEQFVSIGIDNIIFVRSSDEQMGGEVVHERLIAEKAVSEREYH